MKLSSIAVSEGNYFNLSAWLLPITLAVFLMLVSFYNFLFFHTLAEFFAIVIAILTCVIAWNMYPFTRNNYLMYIGAGYFWIGILDLMHTLNYRGMGLFTDGGANAAVQLWIGTRYFEALLLLSAPWFLKHSFNRINSFVFFGAGALIIILLVKFGYFPDGFIEGKGLTPFKVYSEYLIILFLAASIFYLVKQKSLLENNIVKVMIVSIVFTMAAELAFTFYVDVYGISNIVGHILKLFSYWLIFMAVIRTTLKEPFLAMARSSSTYDAIPDATIVVDEQGVIRQANIKACELIESEIGNVVGQSSHDLFHPQHIQSKDCPVCQAVVNNEELKSLEVKLAKKERWLDYSLSHIEGASGTDGTVEVIRDITQRKLSEEKVEELDTLKNSIVENLPSMLFVKDANDHRYVEWNKAAEEISGFLKEEMLGKNDFSFWPKEEAQFFIDRDDEVIKGNKLFDIPQEQLTTKYKGVRTLHTKKIPIFDSEGNAKYLLGISEDITDKLKTEEMLSRSQKMDAVGQMSGGIAHDFNNQLGVILGYVDLLSEQNLPEAQLKWIAAVRSAGERCAELTNQLLIFSRKGEVDKTIINVNDIITEMKAMIMGAVTPQVDIKYFMAENLWLTETNFGGCQDAILNLILNSRDAMPGGGSLTVETSNIILDESNTSVLPNVSEGDYIQIMVSDTGGGMSQDVIKHVFEPFYTTKDIGKGTGLGLSMVYGFVHRYGGDISLESNEGEGSTFRIYLPRSIEDNSILENKSSEGDVFPNGYESILIVDDEEALLRYGEQILKAWGYEVYSAINAADALKVLESRHIDLLFSDIVMPGGMGGYELAKNALEMNSKLKVLITSGYADKMPKDELDGKSSFELISKPYNRKDLAEKLRQLLDE